MKPVDCRNATFEKLREELAGMRRDVYLAWVFHGHGTTRECAAKGGIDLLTFRPRTTELCECGLVRLVGTRDGGEGVYAAARVEEWEAWRRDFESGQMQLL